MSVAALILRSEFKIDLSPLLTFADRNVEEPDDADALERAWQDAAPLAKCCQQVAEALASAEKRLVALRDEYPSLRDTILELGRVSDAAAQRGARVRVTYLLADDA